MLTSLNIRNVILIKELTLDFDPGLCVLTGETGAGKSILLDALGFALGQRAEARLLRQGADKAVVTAAFTLSSPHPLWKTLQDLDFPLESEELLFRRTLDAEGRSKCYLNDHPLSQTLMKSLGKQLVEIHGQFDHLLEAKTHLEALDTFAKLDFGDVSKSYAHLQEAQRKLVDFETSLKHLQERKSYLTFAIDEIEKIAPQPGEEDTLEEEKAFISHRAKVADVLQETYSNCSPALSGLSESHKALSRIQDLLPEKITPLVEASDRAILEIQEVLESARALSLEVEGTPQSLETLENRLYTLRSLGRKYQTTDLLQTLKTFKEELASLDQGEGHVQDLERAVRQAKEAYLEKATDLSQKRRKTAKALEEAVMRELIPLKLENARFNIGFTDLDERNWGPKGINKVEFMIQTNPGSPPGPLAVIASGGELSRFMLALKAVLSDAGVIPTLIFDEIETGTGGAVASAIGDRLKRLAVERQVLAITHSPQLAAQGQQHFVVFKSIQEGTTVTHVRSLTGEEHHEEIARLLSAEEITEEARAAAKKLMGADKFHRKA